MQGCQGGDAGPSHTRTLVVTTSSGPLASTTTLQPHCVPLPQTLHVSPGPLHLPRPPPGRSCGLCRLLRGHPTACQISVVPRPPLPTTAQRTSELRFMCS